MLARAGEGPALLDVVTYRYSGHSPSDASSYRGRDEIEMWREHDSIRGFGDYLCASTAMPMPTALDAHESCAHVELIERHRRAQPSDLDRISRAWMQADDAIGKHDVLESARRRARRASSPKFCRPRRRAASSVTAMANTASAWMPTGEADGRDSRTLTYAEAIFEAMAAPLLSKTRP